MSDMDLSLHWAQPNRWVFMEVGNKPFVIPSFLISEFERSTRLAIQKRGALNFQTVSTNNPLDETNDDWTTEINGRTAVTSGIENRLQQLTITPPQPSRPMVISTPTSSRNLFGDSGRIVRAIAPGSAERGRDPKIDNFKLFSATYRDQSLPRKDNTYKLPSSTFVCKEEEKWSLASPLFFERFCQNCWEEVVKFGHGPRTWMRVMQAKLASDELQTLSPLFAFSGSYQCRASNTTIEDLEKPNPAEWVRCGSVLIYDARIAETRLREACAYQLESGAKIVPFIQALERAYNTVGIHRNWSREETRRHIIDRFTVETFGTKFMKLFIEAYPTPPLPEHYGPMKDKCKLIAARLELKSTSNAEQAGLQTLIIKEKVKKDGPKQPAKDTGKAPETNSVGNDIQSAINKAVQSALKAFKSTLLITKEKVPEKKPTATSKDPKCPHCNFTHLAYRSISECWMNPAVPLSRVPAHVRTKVQAKRMVRAKANTNENNGGESSSRNTEMPE
jgi:hypothetical protein